jgi:hypothetical protein
VIHNSLVISVLRKQISALSRPRRGFESRTRCQAISSCAILALNLKGPEPKKVRSLRQTNARDDDWTMSESWRLVFGGPSAWREFGDPVESESQPVQEVSKPDSHAPVL